MASTINPNIQVPRFRIIEQIKNVKDTLEHGSFLYPDDEVALRENLNTLQEILGRYPGDIPTDLETADHWGWLDFS